MDIFHEVVMLYSHRPCFSCKLESWGEYFSARWPYGIWVLAVVLKHTEGKEPKMADLLIALINSEKEEDALLLSKILERDILSTFINQTTASGRTALHIAGDKWSPWKVGQLLR